MIFLVTKEHAEKYNLQVLKGDRIVMILEILNKRDKDHVVVIDDIKGQTQVYSYLGLDYKVVVGVPEVPITNALLYDVDSQKVIDFDSFQKRISPKSEEQQIHDNLFIDNIVKGGDVNETEVID